jgi:hypothetical protein
MLLALLTVLPARAHHPPPPSRLADSRPVLATGQEGIVVGLAAGVARFAQTRSGWQRAGKVDRFTRLSSDLTVDGFHRSGLEVGVRLPWWTGIDEDVRTGPADLELSAGWGRGSLHARTVWTLPTGRSGDGGDLSFVDVRTEDGDLTVVSANAQTLPGLGVATAGAWVGAGPEVGAVRLQVQARVAVPLGVDDSGIRWGPDVASAVGVQLSEGVVIPGVGVDAAWHGRDVLVVLPADVEEPDADERPAANARFELGVVASVQGSLSDRVRCHAAGTVPVLRWTSDTQVFSGPQLRTGCTIRVDRRRDDAVE